MRLGGLQKTTLLDFPGRVACTVFTVGCNFRCPFCHNSSLIESGATELFDENEFFSFLQKRKGILDGVCITGGEPLLQEDICNFIKKIKELGFLVKLDTNGSYPKKLSELIDNKLVDYVAMDIKSPLDKYALVAGTDKFNDKIKESINILINSDVDFEFRTTTVEELHQPEDFEKIGELIRGAKKYFIQSYKESDGVLKKGLSPPDKSKLLKMLDESVKYIPEAKIRGVDL